MNVEIIIIFYYETSRINLCEFSIISTILLFRIKKIKKFGYLLYTFAWIGKQRSFPYHAKNTIILLNCYPSKLSSNSLQSANTLETITAHVRLNRFSKRRREGREVAEGARTLYEDKKLLNSVFLLGQVERDTIITRYCNLREKLRWKGLDVSKLWAKSLPC